MSATRTSNPKYSAIAGAYPMPQFSAPLPRSARKIYPPMTKRAAFAALGIAAILVRALTAPWRRLRGSRDLRAVLYEPFGMGDALAMQPLALAYADAGYDTCVAVREEWRSIFPARANLEVAPVSPSYAGRSGRRTLRDLLEVARALRPRSRGAVGIDVRGDVRSILILYLAGCRRVETLRRYFTANDCAVMPFSANRRHPVLKGALRVAQNAVFLGPGMGRSIGALPDLGHLREKGGLAQFVAVVPLASWRGKEWEPSRWREVMRRLEEDGDDAVVLHGPGEAAAAARAVGADEAFRPELRECRDVASWVRELGNASLVLTVNTGPMHIAAALGRKIILLEGTCRLPLWAPCSPSALVIHHQNDPALGPCHQVDANLGHALRCMSAIVPADIPGCGALRGG